MRGVAVLGSTGSIGESTLAVLARHRDSFRLVALTAGHNRERLEAQVATSLSLGNAHIAIGCDVAPPFDDRAPRGSARGELAALWTFSVTRRPELAMRGVLRATVAGLRS